jgi:ribonuclease P protein component
VAVRRNRAKRIFRELVRQFHRELLPGHAVLIFPKRDALAQPYAELRRMWETVLLRADLLRPRSH